MSKYRIVRRHNDNEEWFEVQKRVLFFFWRSFRKPEGPCCGMYVVKFDSLQDARLFLIDHFNRKAADRRRKNLKTEVFEGYG